MNVLVIGSGGREHSLCWKIAQSQKCQELYCIPGNGGISKIANCINLDPSIKSEIYSFCLRKKIDLVIVGPEAYLEQGLSDYLTKKKINVFGPSKKAAKLETSKLFSKKFLKRYKIPTANFKAFNDFKSAKLFIDKNSLPFVIKVDGLASGKGVFICKTKKEAVSVANDILINKKFNNAGKKILIEEYLEGFELSYFIFFDKNNFSIIGYALDHKRIKDGDIGPNTGGMGAFAPSKKITRDLDKLIQETIIQPTSEGLKKENLIYRGVLFVGLMITKDGPKVIEYNVRFGDPECQVLMRQYKSDFLQDTYAVSRDSLNKKKIEMDNDYCVCVVLVSKGYPGRFIKNLEIKNLNLLKKKKDVEIFHSGTRIENNKFYSNGGRVLSITAKNGNSNLARKKVYDILDKINWKDGFYRKDIGSKNF